MNLIAKNIYYQRKKHGHTTQDLANLLNIDKAKIERWEQIGEKPEITQLMDIASIYNVPLDYLLTNTSFPAFTNVEKTLNKEAVNPLLNQLEEIVKTSDFIKLSQLADQGLLKQPDSKGNAILHYINLHKNFDFMVLYNEAISNYQTKSMSNKTQAKKTSSTRITNTYIPKGLNLTILIFAFISMILFFIPINVGEINFFGEATLSLNFSLFYMLTGTYLPGKILSIIILIITIAVLVNQTIIMLYDNSKQSVGALILKILSLVFNFILLLCFIILIALVYQEVLLAFLFINLLNLILSLISISQKIKKQKNIKPKNYQFAKTATIISLITSLLASGLWINFLIVESFSEEVQNITNVFVMVGILFTFANVALLIANLATKASDLAVKLLKVGSIAAIIFSVPTMITFYINKINNIAYRTKLEIILDFSILSLILLIYNIPLIITLAKQKKILK